MPTVTPIQSERKKGVPTPGRTLAIPQTTKAALTFPTKDVYLHRIQQLGNGTHVGAIQLNYNGAAQAYFPVAATAYWDYDVNYKFPGQTFPNASITQYGSAFVAINYIVGETPSPTGPPIEFFRCTALAATAETNTGIALSGALSLGTITYDVGPAQPRALVGFTVASQEGTIVLPAIGAWQLAILCYLETQTYPMDFIPTPGPFPVTNTLPLYYTGTSTGNLSALAYY